MMAKATSIRFDDHLADYLADKGVQPDAKAAIDDYVVRFSPLLEKLKDR